MKTRILAAIFLSAVPLIQVTAQQRSQPVIIDHTCTDLSKVPEKYVNAAKKKFKLAYGHTSHGSQIVSGMKALANANDLYRYNRDGSGNALSLWDYNPRGDLGNPNRTEWARRTRELLEGNGRDRNLMMWSWCGQAGSASERDIDTYLSLMSKLEKEFPNVTFVYMTGHLNGSGARGNLNRSNEQIREYCRKNGKALFDFADIESYDPDGKVNFMELYGRDNCDYRKDGGRGNWAREWITNNPNHGLALPSRAAHTHPLNGALKGRAFWWMIAQLAGWNPPAKQPAKKITPVKRSGTARKEATEKTVTPSPEKTTVSGKAVTKIYRFKKAGEYRDWKEFGTKKSVIPETETGLDIPSGGKPALAVYRNPVNLSKLEFKARVLHGNHVNWYVNSKLTGSWRPSIGLGGIIRNDGCLLTVDGKVIKIPNSPRIDKEAHHYRVYIKNGELIWKMDNKLITKRRLPDDLANRKGSVGIGAYNSNVKVSGIYLKGTE